MVRLEVKSSEVREHRGTGKQGPYVIRKQSAYLDTGKAYPVEVAIRLREDQHALQPGMYEVGAQCFYDKPYGEVGVDLAKALPVKAARVA